MAYYEMINKKFSMLKGEGRAQSYSAFSKPMFHFSLEFVFRDGTVLGNGEFRGPRISYT